MAISTTQYKNIKPEHIEFLLFLDDNEIDVFDIDQVRAEYEKSIDINEMLENLCRHKMIHRIERGKYVRYSFRDPYTISNYLVSDGVVAYWSALNLHGMTEQISNTVFVQTIMKKQDKQVFGVQYKFVKVKLGKLFGVEISGYGNNAYRISDKEKTIIDCFDLPQYGGEFPGIVRAFVSHRFSQQKLIEYGQGIFNHAAIKRMGYLAELYDLPVKSFISFAKSKVTKTISKFDINGSNDGVIKTNWGLRLNISEEDIKKFKEY
ncbi:MAG: hypothetical protein HN352_12120 [Bacteroidetes bacterium]|jgi:predicted transcriptional regulator of viral defense system|nr:hypothetical protein [Bacteroidota bacterium]MBT3749451.1 hypothetical protein [Bacteroidota bacterium]MBT4401966.1 hypothetical protein [Bacteroidota bacterium]MBT4410434.1 hypothetical protein [Bacteroidota bacterium]MBT7092261.1 hypothetical protein [Bacteroidota bacterium]